MMRAKRHEPRHESRHEPGPESLWGESWYVDFADAAGRGGFLRLGLLPNLRTAWLWAAWVEPGTVVLVRDHEVALPRGGGLEVRGSGLWADLICETPMAHWTFGLEAFGVALDDPRDALGDERGERTPLGFDLEWEAAEPPYEFPQPAGRTHHGHLQHRGRVHGEVLVGRERHAFDGWGQRDHFWGVRDWWGLGWHWAAFGLGDAVTVSVARPDRPGPEHATGYVAVEGDEPHPVTFAEVETKVGADGLPVAVSYTLDAGLHIEASVLAPVPLLVPSPEGGRTSQLVRALCRFDSPEGQGVGWAEWLAVSRR